MSYPVFHPVAPTSRLTVDGRHARGPGRGRPRVKGTSVNALIVESLAAEIERVRADDDFTPRARTLLERDKELLERLAK